MRFAIASAMRQQEIRRIRWGDVDAANWVVLVHGRKKPREKTGNDQLVPLLHVTGLNALHLAQEQRRIRARGDRIFAYNSLLTERTPNAARTRSPWSSGMRHPLGMHRSIYRSLIVRSAIRFRVRI